MRVCCSVLCFSLRLNIAREWKQIHESSVVFQSGDSKEDTFLYGEMGRYSGKSCRLVFMLTMTSVFFLAEIVAGYVGNSIALVSDSFNMLSDILSLSVGLVAVRLRRRSSSPRCTYGLVRVEVLGALANAVFLAAVRFSVSAQALERLAQPEAIDKPALVLVVGSIGLCINLIGLLVFQDWRCLRTSKARTTRRDSKPKNTDTEAGKHELVILIAMCYCDSNSFERERAYQLFQQF